MAKKKHPKKAKQPEQPEPEPKLKSAPKPAAAEDKSSAEKEADDLARLTELGLIIDDEAFERRIAEVEARRNPPQPERRKKKLLISPMEYLTPDLPYAEAPRVLSYIGNGTFENRDLTNLRICDAICTLLYNLTDGVVHCMRFWNVVKYKHISYTLNVRNGGSHSYPSHISIRRCGKDIFVLKDWPYPEKRLVQGICLCVNDSLAWEPAGMWVKSDISPHGDFEVKPMAKLRQMEREIAFHILRNRLWESCLSRTWDVEIEPYTEFDPNPADPYPKEPAAEPPLSEAEQRKQGGEAQQPPRPPQLPQRPQLAQLPQLPQFPQQKLFGETGQARDPPMPSQPVVPRFPMNER